MVWGTVHYGGEGTEIGPEGNYCTAAVSGCSKRGWPVSSVISSSCTVEEDNPQNGATYNQVSSLILPSTS